MKKFFKVFLFGFILVSGLIFVSCGKKELTGLHKEFDVIFNGIKEEVTTEFKNNLDTLEKEVQNSSRNELETKIQLKGIEILLEGFNKSSYEVENINDMGDTAELKIKVKGFDFFEALQQIITNTTEDKANLVNEERNKRLWRRYNDLLMNSFKGLKIEMLKTYAPWNRMFECGIELETKTT